MDLEVLIPSMCVEDMCECCRAFSAVLISVHRILNINELDQATEARRGTVIFASPSPIKDRMPSCSRVNDGPFV